VSTPTAAGGIVNNAGGATKTGFSLKPVGINSEFAGMLLASAAT
jgi:hypothetical protein